MYTSSLLRNRILKLTLTVLILVLVALFIPYLGKYVNGCNLSRARVEKVMQGKWELANLWLDRIHLGDFPTGKDGETLFREKGIALFFRNDTADWWSTHAVALQDDWTEMTLSNGITIPGNGYYLPIAREETNGKSLALILLKRQYPYKNQYLPNRFHKDWGVSERYKVSWQNGEEDFYSPEGLFVFSLQSSGSNIPVRGLQVIGGMAWIMAFVLLSMILYHFYLMLAVFKGRHLMIILGFTIDILLIRWLIFHFRIPHVLHDTGLFQPFTYAASAFIPSLGDLLLHAITLCGIIWVAFRHLRRLKKGSIHALAWHWIISLGGNGFIMLLAWWAGSIFQSLILDSSISFGLDDPFSLSWYSLLGYFTVFLIFLSWFLLAYRWTWLLNFYKIKFMPWLITLLTVILLAIWLDEGEMKDYLMYIFAVLFLLVFRVYQREGDSKNQLSLGIICLLGVSVLLTILLQLHHDHKEKEKRKLLAVRMSQSRDQVAEYLFKDMQVKLASDSTLLRLVNESLINGDEGVVKGYLRQTFFTDYWDRYELMVTVCAPGRLLEVKPTNYVIDCKEYFQDLIRHIGQPSGVDSLFFIDFGIDNSSYLATLPFKMTSSDARIVMLFLEIFPRQLPRGMGYPELLMDEGLAPEPLREYAYAIYRHDELIRRVGRYYYSNSASAYNQAYHEGSFFTDGGYSHYMKAIDRDTMIIISSPRKSALDFMAPFSYLLVFATLLMMMFYFASPGVIFRLGKKRMGDGFSLRARLQFSMVAVVMISFVMVALASLWFLTRINQDKNHFTLSEKAHSVLIELEHKLHDNDMLGPAESARIQELLNKFSTVFFSDINLYDINGRLLASSRNRIFDEGLISHRMNAEAWHRLGYKQESMVILDECIGDYRYLSAYVPFRNNRNELLAYLNLPYFARQAELRQEIAGFLVTIINIYVLLIAITLTTALVVSGYITRPLQLIGEKIKRVGLGDVNEHLEWYRKDEIGSLVQEYNRMVDQLAVSAEMLASSERDLAWREMARQVAHEIKNPLTPMKLSVQYLQRAWNDKAADWDERLKRFTATITEQIDTLSDIATAFSDFARMPRTKNGIADLGEMAIIAMDTYRSTSNIKIIQDWDHNKQYSVKADRSQLLRVFNNLLKNAIQAIGDEVEGMIEISIKEEPTRFLVNISDNGPGIPGERRSKIFLPNFTTKTSGMGLGLAIVKNIVLSFGGEVWYDSEEGAGTVFHFTIPKPTDRPPAILD